MNQLGGMIRKSEAFKQACKLERFVWRQARALWAACSHRISKINRISLIWPPENGLRWSIPFKWGRKRGTRIASHRQVKQIESPLTHELVCIVERMICINGSAKKIHFQRIPKNGRRASGLLCRENHIKIVSIYVDL